MSSKIWTISKAKLKKLIKECDSASEVAHKISKLYTEEDKFSKGYSGNYNNLLYCRCYADKLDLSIFEKYISCRNKRKRDGGKLNRRQSSGLVRILLEKYNVPYKCSCCGMGHIWNKQPLQLHLDHIDGDSLNDNIDNLRLICPNCHTQTDTYSGGNAALRHIKDRKKYL